MSLRILVLGYIVRGPLGGLVWHHLQYVLGLARLGHDVYFLEDSDDYASCYDPVRNLTDTDPTYGLAFAARAFAAVGLPDRWAYHDAHVGQWRGPCAERALELCRGAELLLNLSGINPLRPWLREVPARVLVDTDPVFTQIRHLTAPACREFAALHTAFLSFAGNIGQRGCSVPDDGFPWQPTRQPVVLDAWPVTPGPPDGPFTTVMQWSSYPVLEYGGRRHGMKRDSFEPYVDLPQKAGPVFELAVTAPPEECARLTEKGWRLLDAREPTRESATYGEFIRRSKAEFSVAKHGYVVSRSGWFSERSVCYLASGRPVVLQDTGYSDWLHADAGVIPFTTSEGALEGIEEVNRRYPVHCRAARAVAEEYFDARKVLPRLLERSLLPSGKGLAAW